MLASGIRILGRLAGPRVAPPGQVRESACGVGAFEGSVGQLVATDIGVGPIRGDHRASTARSGPAFSGPEGAGAVRGAAAAGPSEPHPGRRDR